MGRNSVKTSAPRKPKRVYLGIRVRPEDRDEWYRMLANDDLSHAPALFAKMIQVYKDQEGRAC